MQQYNKYIIDIAPIKTIKTSDDSRSHRWLKQARLSKLRTDSAGWDISQQYTMLGPSARCASLLQTYCLQLD